MKPVVPIEVNRQDLAGAMTRGELLFAENFNYKDAGVDNKTLNAWKLHGLLDFVEKGKWAKFSFTGLLWLKVLETLRRYGCSVKQMKELYGFFFTRAFDENLAEKNLIAHIDYYEQLSKLRILTEDETNLLHYANKVNADPDLKSVLRLEVSYFSQLIMHCFDSGTEAGIILFQNGVFRDYLNDPDQPERCLTTADLEKPHLRIPISFYIVEFISDESRSGFISRSGLLSEDEFTVLKEMRRKNLKSLSVTFKDIDRKIEKIECTEAGQISGEKAKKIMQILGMKNYEGMELHTKDSKTLSFKHTAKTFFKSSV